MHIDTNIDVHIYIYIYMYNYVCMHTYIYACFLHTQIRTYIHRCIYRHFHVVDVNNCDHPWPGRKPCVLQCPESAGDSASKSSPDSDSSILREEHIKGVLGALEGALQRVDLEPLEGPSGRLLRSINGPR